MPVVRLFDGVLLAVNDVAQHGGQTDGKGRAERGQHKQQERQPRAAALRGLPFAVPEAEGKQEQAVGQRKGQRHQLVERNRVEGRAGAQDQDGKKEQRRQEERQISGAEGGRRLCAGCQAAAADRRYREAATDDGREDAAGKRQFFNDFFQDERRAVTQDKERGAAQGEEEPVHGVQVQRGADQQEKNAHDAGRDQIVPVLLRRRVAVVRGGGLLPAGRLFPFARAGAGVKKQQEQDAGQQESRYEPCGGAPGDDGADEYKIHARQREAKEQQRRQQERLETGDENGCGLCAGSQPAAARRQDAEVETDDHEKGKESVQIAFQQEHAQQCAEGQEANAHGNGCGQIAARGLRSRTCVACVGGAFFLAVARRLFPCVAAEAEGKQEQRVQQTGADPQILQHAQLFKRDGKRARHPAQFGRQEGESEDRRQQGEQSGGYGARQGRFGGQPGAQLRNADEGEVMAPHEDAAYQQHEEIRIPGK